METSANDILEMGMYVSELFHERYPYIYTDLPPAFFGRMFYTMLAVDRNITDAKMLDLMQDHILANGLAEHVAE